MPAKAKRSIADQLNAAQVAVNNTLSDAEIQGLVAQYGFDATRIQQGEALHEAAVAAVDAQTAAHGMQRDATAGAEAAKREAWDACQALTQVARAAFARNREQLAVLGLGGRAPRTTAAFLTAAYTLFDNALRVEPVAAVLAQYGYDATRLQSERARVEGYDRANQAQEAAKGAAQQSTRDQAAALTALNDWVAQYLRVAKVALRNRKELLEKLGVTARAAKTAAQRAGAKKAAATKAAKKAE